MRFQALPLRPFHFCIIQVFCEDSIKLNSALFIGYCRFLLLFVINGHCFLLISAFTTWSLFMSLIEKFFLRVKLPKQAIYFILSQLVCVIDLTTKIWTDDLPQLCSHFNIIFDHKLTSAPHWPTERYFHSIWIIYLKLFPNIYPWCSLSGGRSTKIAIEVAKVVSVFGEDER